VGEKPEGKIYGNPVMMVTPLDLPDTYSLVHETISSLAGWNDLDLTACGPECGLERFFGSRTGDLPDR
jgi:hypothetical protein